MAYNGAHFMKTLTVTDMNALGAQLSVLFRACKTLWGDDLRCTYTVRGVWEDAEENCIFLHEGKIALPDGCKFFAHIDGERTALYPTSESTVDFCVVR